MQGAALFADSGSTAKTATGLGRFGEVSLLEPPHSGGNYLLREMGFQIGRKHADKLRVIGLVLGVLPPALLALATPFGAVWAGLAMALHLAGVLAIRWLFFAEARHVVSLYYGYKAETPSVERKTT